MIKPGEVLLLSGNEAIARGAWESDISVCTGYPGTPSTEILETITAEYPDISSEWSVNEKVALEVGIGSSLAGARTLVAMKHVGVNVAADPLFTASYIGIKGGLVIVAAGTGLYGYLFLLFLCPGRFSRGCDERFRDP